eukprot:TRINITY_DN4013_c0_g2_i1.p1 TRINITY_DN4013_c0_g2~~TRINITY_DN4013_c0_g2_i1.p1  ORF type:complete len:378 (+),score=97.06 TRINITY_DN4013_c0_g2_i1:36-1136(+)
MIGRSRQCFSSPRSLRPLRAALPAASGDGWLAATLSHSRGAERLPPALGGCLASPVGSIRTKKWKPFHSMYRSNHLRKLAEAKAAEAKAQQAAAAEAAREAEEDWDQPLSAATPRADEPHVMTTPFQATRILRACDVFPDTAAKVEFWTKLNVDLTRESVRGTVHLPHGLQTSIKVLAFCPDDEVQEMIKAGADVAGITEPIRKINQGWLEFDRCIATPAVMPQVMKVAKILGPRKLMPNPRSGTVVQNLKQAIREAKGGTLLEYRAEGDGELRATIADANFPDAKLLENMKFLVQTLLRARPRSAAAAADPKAKAPPTALLGGAGAGAEVKDSYFLEASLKLGEDGPPVRVDPESMLPSSVGYFR